MNRCSILLYLIGAIICFALFVTGMLYTEQIALLMFVGIVGFSGFSFFIFRIVFSMLSSEKNE